MQYKALITKLLLLSLFILSSTFAYAQYEDLEKDKNIIWIAEFTMDHSFAPIADDINTNQIIKFYQAPTSFEEATIDNWLIYKIFDNIYDGQYQYFKDNDLKKEISHKEIIDFTNAIDGARDTLITYDPETYESRIKVVTNAINLEDVKGFRCKQVIYYHKKENNFQTRLVAIAPLLMRYDTKEIDEIFWIKMDSHFPTNFNINDQNITWGNLSYNRTTPLEIDQVEVIKRKKKFDFQKKIYQQALKLEKKIEFESFGSNELATKEILERMHSSVDTIITYDPETYNETMRVVKNEMKLDEVKTFRFIQEWYYDKSKKQLINRLRAIVPVIAVTDDEGNFRFNKPLYYINMD